jgi:hypothetical protein
MPPKTGQFGQQSRSTFSRSRGRGDDTRSRRRRRRCCVTLIITGSRFGRRCCLGTAFIVCRSAITSVCDRDIGVEGTFRTASGMGARRRGDHYRTSLWVAPSLDVGRIVPRVAARDPRSLSSTRASTFPLTKCVAAAKLELSDPLAAPHPCANPRCCPPTRCCHHHNYRHSTPSRRANAVATIAAPLHAVRSRGRIAASCRASVHTVGARRPRLARRRYVVGCRRATWGGRRAMWGGQRPVGPCTLVPSGTRPSRQEPAGGAVLVLRVVVRYWSYVWRYTPSRTCACSQV